MSHDKALAFPVFREDRASRLRAKRVRKIYSNILNVIMCAKQKKARRAALICSKLMNSSLIEYLPNVSQYTNHISYHTSSGKFRKNSYKMLIKFAKKPLHELEQHIKASEHLMRPVKYDKASSLKSKKLVKPHDKPAHTFSALEDLERIKQMVVETKEKSVETIIKEARREKKIAPPKPKKTDVEETTEDIAKSVSQDDAFVFKTLSKEKDIISLEIGECKLFKRGVVMNKTHIPNIVWKRVFAQLGLQIVAKQYVTAVYAPILASPAEEGGEAFEPEMIVNHARQFLGSYNRKQKDVCMQLEIVGEAFKTRTSSHWFWLLMPKCVADNVGFRMGSWSFTNTPRVETAKPLALM